MRDYTDVFGEYGPRRTTMDAVVDEVAALTAAHDTLAYRDEDETVTVDGPHLTATFYRMPFDRVNAYLMPGDAERELSVDEAYDTLEDPDHAVLTYVSRHFL